MKKTYFMPADILMPQTDDMVSWSVIACDQFTSDRGYWDDVAEKVRGKFSTFHMVLPEAYLNDAAVQDVAKEKNEIMDNYLASGVFDILADSFVYVERKVDGGVRHGLVGKIDLEAYDYSPDKKAAIRASERTVEERLPPRMVIREDASIEMPHAMVLIDDEEKSIVEPLRKRVSAFKKIYDFELMKNGGRITGYEISGEEAEKVKAALEKLSEGEIQMIVGDGNHSLAAAKECWNVKKRNIDESLWEDHPARYALVELVNVYDEGVIFEPIHRVVWGADAEKLVELFKEKLGSGEGKYEVVCIYNGKTEKVKVRGQSFGTMMKLVQEFVFEYVTVNDSVLDYIHDDSAAKAFADDGAVAFLLPVMPKDDFFKTVAVNGIFPEKSFSIGHAKDKRYYLECRKIK